MNKQDINEFRKIERKYYKKMRKECYADVPLSHSFVGCNTFLTRDSERATSHHISSIFEVPFKDYNICVQINNVIRCRHKRNKVYKKFIKMAQRYFRQKCKQESYVYQFTMLPVDQPFFYLTKMKPSMKILNQLE